ncbi:Uncharacterized protein TCM_032266 [Theobroma cacao]|uniref:Protein kinase domain-containing protein n=1 Tax=Theobroma cacao TaxID=3641 RepID=A0A061FGR8_THECC|nr:Uncharacterized protein TCM_032266 [Theobroma cacao]
MPKPKAQLPWFGLMAAFALFLLPEACIAGRRNKDCGFTLCGDVNISYPFRLTSQTPKCGDHRYELECDNNNRTTLVMKHGRLYVQNISYGNHTIQVVDANVGRDDCFLPRFSKFYDTCKLPYRASYRASYLMSIISLVNCTTPMKSSLYVDASRCPNRSSHPPTYFYFLDEGTLPVDFNQFCTVEAQVPVWLQNISNMSTSDIYKKLLLGFELSWIDLDDFPYHCTEDKLQVILDLLLYAWETYVGSLVNLPYSLNYGDKSTYICLGVTGGVILLRALPGICCLIVVVTYKWRRRHLSVDDMIEEFLQSQNDLMPIRYSYREIKRMTKNFRDKLGEGGYGSVFKGKLRSGHFVAIKLLDENFIPKVSDFGLAKLYSVDDSIVSLTAARGTIGYIAPELVYKNIGGISYKADVYSFGMLLMEMVGRRKNLNRFAEHLSQRYFPSWIYGRFHQGEDIELGEATDVEKIIVKKMIITACWCIQVTPNNRPSMSKVLQMLETDVKLLQMPPKPFQLPFEISTEDHVDDNPSEDPTSSLLSSNEISLNIV